MDDMTPQNTNDVKTQTENNNTKKKYNKGDA